MILNSKLDAIKKHGAWMMTLEVVCKKNIYIKLGVLTNPEL